MSFARVCNSGMYRSALFVTMTLSLLIGCNKPAEEETPPAEPVAEEAKAETPKPAEPAADETAKEETPKPAEPASLVLKDVGFKTPESVYYDETNDIYLVSNINGSPTEADNNGFISKVTPAGEVTALKWIAGGENEVTLNAPKGMVVSDNTLYVADIDTVRMFDNATGAAKGEVAIKGATFLNGIAVGPTNIMYVSDSGMASGEKKKAKKNAGAIWTIKDGKAEKLIAGVELNRPNGLLADEGGVWVVTLGGTELYRVTDEGKRETPISVPNGSLDGLVKTADGDLLISSWDAKAVFKGKPGGVFAPVVADITSPAGLGYDMKRNRVLIPVFEGDAVQIQTLGTGAAAAGLRSDAPEPEVAADKADAEEGNAEEAKAGKPAEPEPLKAAADDAEKEPEAAAAKTLEKAEEKAEGAKPATAE